MVKVAINGFGRIGRNVLRAGLEDKEIEFVAINDLSNTKTMAHLFKHDSSYGHYEGEVKHNDEELIIDGKKIKLCAEKDPENLPWKKLGVDVVLECTGFFRTYEAAYKHIKAGAKKVIISAPPKGEKPVDFTVVLGVNDKDYNKTKDIIISNASCTTNCLAPLSKVLNDNFEIIEGVMTTVHAYTNDQNILDGPHSDLRRARTAAQNIIPTTTGAAIAVTKVIPELKGKLTGIAIRVPVPVGSLVDLVVQLKKDATVEDLNKAIKKAANGKFKGIIEYSEEPLVSSDIIGNPHSCIFDASSTVKLNKMFKLLAWYDNEWGYSNRMVDLLKML